MWGVQYGSDKTSGSGEAASWLRQTMVTWTRVKALDLEGETQLFFFPCFFIGDCSCR